MIAKLRARFAHNKYRLIVFVLLALASLTSILIFRFRVAETGDMDYVFLIWNLFLAWIPFLISYVLYTTTIRRKWLYLIVPFVAFLWLIFFPNAPYILTDLQHLTRAGVYIPVWYDVMMLVWFSWTGLLLGIVSLFLMQEIIRREFGRWIGWGFVALVIGLSAAGIYMGRFLRWNSWDILNNPLGIARFTFERAQDPSLESLLFMGIFAAFLLFLYVTMYAFGHLLLERQGVNLEVKIQKPGE